MCNVSPNIIDIDDLIDSDFEERMLLKISFREKDKISKVIETITNPNDNHFRLWKEIYGFTEKEFEKNKGVNKAKKDLLNEIRNFLEEELPQLNFNESIRNSLESMSYLRLFSVSIQIKELFFRVEQ
jgi:hypothetical protein